MTKRALRARGHALCAPQRRTMSLPAHTRPRLCQHHRGICRWTPRWCSAVGGIRWRRLVGRREAQRRKGESGAAGDGPARSHEAVARSAPLRAASQPPLWREHRSEVGAQRRPTQQEPPSDTAHRAAL